MSILIEGLDMPIEYGRCMVIFPDGRVTTEFGSQVVAKAAPVPPHGRLIDADEFIIRITELMRKAEADEFYLGEAWYATFIRHIELAPTTIPAEPPKEEAK